jgi:hypothetical protein
MLRLGAMGAAGAILSSAASSSTVPSLLMPATPLPATPNPFPAVQPPLATAPGGIDPQLFARAKAALDNHKIGPRDSIGIVDFSQPSERPSLPCKGIMSSSAYQALWMTMARGSAL